MQPLRLALFSTKPYDRAAFTPAAAAAGIEVVFHEARLNATTAVLAAGCQAACAFVNDDAGAASLEALAEQGVGALVMRCAGYDRVDLAAAAAIGLRVARVPAYAPRGVAEHAVALLLLLNRKLHRAWNRVREGNFALDGLVGFELADKTVGILGTGRIGQAAARIFSGFGCRVLLHDRFPQPAATAWGGVYVSQEHLLAESEVVSLHIPLTRENHHLFDERLFAAMKPGAYLINTSRGGLIDTRAAIEALKTGRLGGLALDVYEGEEGLFFEDRSQQVIADDVFTRLLTLPNVVITAHQAFLTREALANIAEVTLANARALRDGLPCDNEVRA